MGFGIWSKSIDSGPLEVQQYPDSAFPKPCLEHLLHLWGELSAVSDTSSLRKLIQQ